MKPELQIKALAELDGWTNIRIDVSGSGQHYLHGRNSTGDFSNPPNYLTSYDAIIPLIQKQPYEVKCNMWNHLDAESDLWDATPQQLCEALLRATNKWIEE